MSTWLEPPRAGGRCPGRVGRGLRVASGHPAPPVPAMPTLQPASRMAFLSLNGQARCQLQWMSYSRAAGSRASTSHLPTALTPAGLRR